MFRLHAVADPADEPRPGPGDLKIRSERDRHRHLLAPVGELDVATAPALDEELRRVEDTDVREIIVDLGGLEFIDSTGLRILIQASARSRAHGDRLMLLRGAEHVHRRFELSGLSTRLPFADRDA